MIAGDPGASAAIGRTASRTDTIGAVFDGQPNGLNLLRLLLALEVLAWHAKALRGGHLPVRLEAFVGDVGVDSFFAISGFLITRAWMRSPHLGRFLVSRGRRLLPGLWVCLVLTGFVLAPLAALVSGQDLPSPVTGLHYVAGNASTVITSHTIGATTSTLPVDDWNGSLWSLQWEVACYLLVAALGVLRLLRPRVMLGLAAAFWVQNVLLALSGVPLRQGSMLVWEPQRAGIMFACGALLWCYRDVVRLDGRIAALALACVPISVLALDNYRIIAAPAVAYLLVWLAVRLGRFRMLVLRHDLSYGVYIYAFPIQQALLLAGIGSAGWVLFLSASLVGVIPVAAGSWFLVERPAQRVGRRRTAGSRQAPRPSLRTATTRRASV